MTLADLWRSPEVEEKAPSRSLSDLWAAPTAAAPTPQERLRAFQERFPGAQPGLDPKVAPGEPPAVERQGLLGRLGEYQEARGRSLLDTWQSGLWDLTQIPKTVAELDLAAKKLVLPKALEPFAEAQNRPGIRLLEEVQPDWVKERAEVSRAEMEASKQAKAEAGLALGLPDAAQVAENFAEDALSMAADPLELLPGGAAARGVRALVKGRRTAKAAPDLATTLRRGGVLAPDAPTPRPGDVWFDPARGESYQVVETRPDSLRVRWEGGETEEIFEAEGRSHRILEPASQVDAEVSRVDLDVDPFEELARENAEEAEALAAADTFEPLPYSEPEARARAERAPGWLKMKPMRGVLDQWSKGEISDSEAAFRGLVETGVLGRDEAAKSFVREGGYVRLSDELVNRPPGSHREATEMAFTDALEDLSRLSGSDSLQNFGARYEAYSDELQRWREQSENQGPDLRNALDPQPESRHEAPSTAPSVWRESGFEDVQRLLPETGVVADTTKREVYLADAPDLALGQGSNRGVLVEFDPSRLELETHRGKPGLDFLEKTGGGRELVGKVNPQESYQSAVRSVTIRPDAPVDNRAMAVRFRRWAKRMESEGWKREALPDGSIKLSRPRPLDGPVSGNPGEAGFLRIGKEPFQPKDPNQPRPPDISPLRRWFSSEGEFEPAGDLRSTFTGLREKATGDTKADLWRAERNWRLVEREIKGSSADREKANAAVIEYLEAPENARPALAAQLPPGLVEPLEKMRAHTADLQLRAIGTPGLLSEEMAEIYGSRVGQHLTRGYEAFINEKYLDDVRGTKLWDETFDWLRGEDWTKKMSKRQVEGWMEEFVSRGPQMFRPTSRGEVLGKKGSLGAYRQDLPDQLQRFLGRMDDPEYRYKRTVQRLAPDIAEQRMLNEMQALGEGKLFFDNPVAGFSTKIPGTTTKDPLGGKHTTKPMAEVIAGFRGIRSKEPNLVDWFTDQYLRANGLVKTGMTAYSPTTHIRNSGSWGLLGLATGHGIAPVRRAMQAVRALRETGDTGKLLSQIGIKSKSKFENLWEEALRLGVTGQSVHVGHLEDYARWVKRARTDRGKRSVRGALGKPFDVTAKFAETAYALEDDLPKFALWLEEMKLYRKALPKASDDEILRIAARNIRNVTPTWDKVPRGVREISRFPFFGMFPGFQAEMVRNTKNLLKLSFDEIRSKNPRLRKVGAKRVAGLLASLSIPEAVAIAGGAALSGVSMKEQTEDVMRRREFQPEWQRNSSMLYWHAEGEDFRQLDVGFLDPRAGMKRPIMAAVAGILQEQASAPTALGRGALQFGEAFLGSEALVRAVAEAVQNRDERGMPIVNPEAGILENIAGRAGHVVNEDAPGIYRGGRNVVKSLEGERWATGRQRKPWQEALGAWGGVRISDTNVAQSAPYYAWELGERRQNVRRLFAEKIRADLRSDAAQIRPETIQEGVAEAQEAWAKVWEDASRKLKAFKGEGIPQAVAFLDALDSEGGWREEDLLDLVEGNPPPPVVHPEDLERIVEDQMRLYRFDPELSGEVP